MILPVWDDILDRRARQGPQGSVYDLLKSAVPAVAATSAGVASLGKTFLGKYEALSVIGDAVAIIAGAAGIVYVISATVEDAQPLVHGRLMYRFTQVERLAAKVLLVPILLLASYGVWQALPVGLVGPKRINGFVCSSISGMPIVNANVAVLSATGSPVSVPSFSSDSMGFFIIPLKWWGTSPTSLSITTAKCKSMTIRLGESVSAGTRGCRSGDTDIGRSDAWRAWYIDCD